VQERPHAQANAASCTHSQTQKAPQQNRPPTLLTPELIKRICSCVLAGACGHAAAEASGICDIIYREWIRLGEDADKREMTDVYATLATEVRHARANARIAAEIKTKAMDPKWWLPRMYRQDWGDSPTQLEVTGKEGAPLGLTLEMVRQLIDATDREDEERNAR
jgi:hypothetical protein